MLLYGKCDDGVFFAEYIGYPVHHQAAFAFQADPEYIVLMDAGTFDDVPRWLMSQKCLELVNDNRLNQQTAGKPIIPVELISLWTFQFDSAVFSFSNRCSFPLLNIGLCLEFAKGFAVSDAGKPIFC